LKSALFIALCFSCLSPYDSSAQSLAHKGWQGSGLALDPWWKTAVFYELDPLCFQDSNADGIGDLAGVASRLDYLQALGVDAVILSPFQLAATNHPGQDPPALDPVYGTLDDFAELQRLAGTHRIRLLVDIPLSSSRTPADTVALARFWLSRGVAGLRLTQDRAILGDSLSPIALQERFTALRRVTDSFAGQRVLIRDLAPQSISAAPPQAAFEIHSRPTSSPSDPISRSPRSYSVRTSILSSPRPQMSVMDDLIQLSTFTAPAFQSFLQTDSKIQPSDPVLIAHTDQQNLARSLDRIPNRIPGRIASSNPEAPDKLRARAKIFAAILLLSKPSPLLYFGQELGMATAPTGRPQESAAELKAANAKPTIALSPMQWGDAPGLTTGTPLIDPGPNTSEATAQREESDPASLLNWYRKLSALRHGNEAMRSGTQNLLTTGNPQILAWVRRAAPSQPAVFIVCNISAQATFVPLSATLRQAGVPATLANIRTLAVSSDEVSGSPTRAGLALPAYGVYVGQLARHAGLETVVLPARVSRRRGR